MFAIYSVINNIIKISRYMQPDFFRFKIAFIKFVFFNVRYINIDIQYRIYCTTNFSFCA